MNDVELIKSIIRKIDSLTTSDEDGTVENVSNITDHFTNPTISETLTISKHVYTLICGNFKCGGGNII